MLEINSTKSIRDMNFIPKETEGDYPKQLKEFNAKRWVSVKSLTKLIELIQKEHNSEVQFEYLCYYLDEELENNYGGDFDVRC